MSAAAERGCTYDDDRHMPIKRPPFGIIMPTHIYARESIGRVSICVICFLCENEAEGRIGEKLLRGESDVNKDRMGAHARVCVYCRSILGSF